MITVLCNYQSPLDLSDRFADFDCVSESLLHDLDRIARKAGFPTLRSEVRWPDWPSPETPRLQEWHQDGLAFEYLVMWANIHPTFYRIKASRHVVLVNPGDLVLVNNQLVEHRMPIETTGRWFYRGIVNSRGQIAATST